MATDGANFDGPLRESSTSTSADDGAATAKIPAVCHFVWLGPAFPFLNALAVVSAARRGGFERVVLHADHDLASTPFFDVLMRLPQFEVRRIDLDALARAAGQDGGRVRALYDNMTSAAARSDVLRVLALAAEGGVYLDIDTVTVASFDALRTREAFVGQEYICFPDWTTRSATLAERVRAYALAALRLVLRMIPRGYLLFQKVARVYALAVNNAVLGSTPGHPFVVSYLEAMLAADPAYARRPFAIGPDLLARIARDRSVSGLEVLGPNVLYPLPPVISEQWWSMQSAPNLGDVVTTETVSVHWYASVRSRSLAGQVDPAYVQQNRERQLFSKLAAPFLDAFR